MGSARISVTEFRAHCLSLIDGVAAGQSPLTITRHGRPVARVVPIEPNQPADLFGVMRGSATEAGELVSPVGEAWVADG